MKVSRCAALAVVLALLLLVVVPAFAATVTVPISALNGAASGARQIAKADATTYYRVSPVGFVPGLMPAGESAVLTTTFYSDRYAGSWDGPAWYAGIFDVGFTNDPATYNVPPNGYLTRDGIAYQDNSNGMGFCWDDYETVSETGFGAGLCGYADNLYGSLTRFTITVHGDGSFDMLVEHLTPAGDVIGTLATGGSGTQSQSDPSFRGFDPAKPLFPYLRVRVGADTMDAWALDVTHTTLTVDEAALYPQEEEPVDPEPPVVVVTAEPPPPAPRCVDMIGETAAVLIAGGTNDAVNMGAYCRLLVRNGQYLTHLGYAITGIASLGSTVFEQTGVQQAVDVFAPTGPAYFDGGLAVCLKGSGDMMWAAAGTGERAYAVVGSYPSPDYSGFTCVTVFEPGTLVLTGAASATETADTSAAAITSGTATGSSEDTQ